MTLFSPRYMNVSGELKSGRSRAASKRTSTESYGSDADLDYDYHDDYYDRVYDTQRVPASSSPVPQGASPAKRLRSSCFSSRHRRSRDRSRSKCSRPRSSSSNTAKLGLEELQVIKKELTLIKTQIDGLLDSLDRMDTQRTEHKDSPHIMDSPAGSAYSPSGSSPEHSPSLSPLYHRVHRESPEREADDHHTVIIRNSDGEI
ncbi:unnamed protein product [Knipowitschia caucasica]|uniref:RNA-binding Raly-like protein n=1 Tax=Knipowitschia caucasica TaxID=637954 RepID=A0AAV2LTR2_KNICA